MLLALQLLLNLLQVGVLLQVCALQLFGLGLQFLELFLQPFLAKGLKKIIETKPELEARKFEVLSLLRPLFHQFVILLVGEAVCAGRFRVGFLHLVVSLLGCRFQPFLQQPHGAFFLFLLLLDLGERRVVALQRLIQAGLRRRLVALCGLQLLADHRREVLLHLGYALPSEDLVAQTAAPTSTALSRASAISLCSRLLWAGPCLVPTVCRPWLRGLSWRQLDPRLGLPGLGLRGLGLPEPRLGLPLPVEAGP